MPKFKLKPVVKSLDEIPEPFRNSYTEQDGEFHLDFDKFEIDDKAELSTALERERAERKAAKEALESRKDIDPEEYKRLKAEADDRENKKLRDKGEFDRLMEKQKKDWEAKEAEYKKQIDTHASELRTHKLTNKVKEAALKAGVLADDIDDVLTITSRRFDLNDTGKIIVRDQDGDETSMSVDSFFSDVFKTQKPKFYAASGSAGSGAPAGGAAAGGAGGAKSIKRSDFEKMGSAERSGAIKAGTQIVD